jgi:CRISPR-associated protein Cas1
MYQLLARKYKVEWKYRKYDPAQWGSGDIANRCLSAATASLYGVTEAAILAAGYAPAIGFLHTGKPQSFVYDIADLVKFDTVVPAAFQTASQNPSNPEQIVRLRCRDMFRSSRLLERIIPLIEEVLAAGGLEIPEFHEEAMPIAITNPSGISDAGHRA